MKCIKDVDLYLKKTRILVIDDSLPFQNLTGELLKKFGVDSVEFASTLVDGMKKLHYSKDETLPAPKYDLVLFDVNLPDGNGVRGCEFVSNHAATHNIPVVVISGNSQPYIVDAAFGAGASDFLQKPFVPSLLKNRLGCLLKLRALGLVFN
ncbi:MAG: hypothetical protein COA99_15560 [Moraxellaceae bacterium]|nr:MAG: hypothetical protein COA99_15560 [Moraxellaceae bacterium]